VPSTRDALVEIVAREASVDASLLTDDATLERMGVSSLDFVQILFAIEERFSVDLPYQDPSFNVKTFGGLVGAVDALLAQRSSRT
jgi:acyl carrier protein